MDKPWGYELIWAHTDRYVGKVLHINAGHALSVQYHNQKDETVYLLSGEMKYWVKLGDEQFAAEGEWRSAGRLALCGMGVEPGGGREHVVVVCCVRDAGEAGLAGRTVFLDLFDEFLTSPDPGAPGNWLFGG